MSDPREQDGLIPGYTMTTLENYIDRGVPTGGFLRAVLGNDLQEAVARADENNIVALPAIVGWLSCNAPSACWGSPKLVADWLRRFTKEERPA